ncbi:glutathione S-transferase family protein [Psychrobacter sp. AOP22-C1-22]|uniref:glutathione S-transferase family protein n=1 Tax=unclassified Psychrobacter TaxID=196806 RepID=UPI001787CC37|nr:MULTISPECIES: glutathione S-transferase family protein [unclassified Psychrobacter]MDN5801830.1 glutathione S-transferase family protein [Psychrobacter sp.]MBE0406289.1 glutathione S-transferase family protein [Psychrobacter sp. FME6]MBE0445416.1 glutathione S-transferase family protein [Psychrobacter sp. FME5]MDN5892131.1 glutathione S-transferase family protein [Psychrobacter sp.]MDN5897777.1 glutathione S-transferase family protein [Psychrobacter sp.]
MGLLVDGQWQDKWYDTDSSGGRFEREEAGFRNWVTADGSSGPSGQSGFKAEANRYHLYVSLACPWAHRTIIYRKFKGLEDMITMSVVHPFMGDKGWTFAEEEGVIADPIVNASYLYEIYTAAKSDYTGRVTVPILWDKHTNTIVSNESSEIIRMFNSAFDEVGAVSGNFLPSDKIAEIDETNAFVYDAVNNGVYKAGFATTEAAYKKAVVTLFDALDTLEARLENQRYLIDNRITEADWRLFTTLVRFDAVYVGHFKCNIRRIVDYPNLWGYLRDLYQISGIAETVNMDHIKAHYYTSHANINPTRIIPVGPIIDFNKPHDRACL